MNVRQFAEIYVWPFVSQQWLSLAIWEYGLLWAINMWLSLIYAKDWSYRSWAVRTEWTLAVPDNDCCEIKFKTQFPIARVTGIYLWPREIITSTHDICPCDCGKKNCSCWCEVTCWVDTMKSIKNKMVQPWGKLSEFWDYKISWWWYGWWVYWNIVSLYVCNNANVCQCWFDKSSIYITYQARANQITCYTDKIPLPDAFMSILWMYVISLTKTVSWNWKATEDTYWYQLADQLLMNIQKFENNAPSEMRISTNSNNPKYNRLPNKL